MKLPSDASFFNAAVSSSSLLFRIWSTLLFPKRYPSNSSLTGPLSPDDGPAYIQSTRSRRFLPPAVSRIASSSWSCRSSARSFRICSVRFRSSRAFVLSFHTLSWFFSRCGCHDFLRLRSPPIVDVARRLVRRDSDY
ncbi:hypothetical protein ABW19_dt0207923 [Dactylella cylindrospora]|nr:hypothetical protein ABW19_dt0207923 [Dactylella cylindrospora]